jgi:flavin-dependent dehydrogenase
MRRVDALVVGGGPAGSTAAILLARAGWSVAVVEKARFPRRKVCGEYISATTWPVLRELGVARLLERSAGPRVERVGLFTGESAVEAPMPVPCAGDEGRAIGRAILDAALLDQAACAGAAVLQPWTVGEVRAEGGGFVASLREAHAAQTLEIASAIVIDAHGSWEHGPLATRRPRPRDGDLFGFKARFAGSRLSPGLMPLILFPGGYGGMVRTDGDEVSLSCCVRRDALRALRARHPGLCAGDALRAHVASACRAAGEALDTARRRGPWLSAGPIRPGIRALAGDGAFAVGNAAGEAHPLVAEGISMAIQSSWILASVLVPRSRGGPRSRGELSRRAIDEAGREYSARWKAHLAMRIRAASLFAAFTAHPSGARASAAAASRLPEILTWGARWSGKARSLDLNDAAA